MNAPTTDHETRAADLRRQSQNRHRNADELWHLFSRTHDPVWRAQIVTEAQREDRATELLNNAADFHEDQAATSHADAEILPFPTRQ